MRTVFALILALAAFPVLAQPVPSSQSDWPQEKCRRYRLVYDALIARRSGAGLGAEFLRSHDAFLASGCTERASVCPRSAAEIALANDLTIMAMNFGTASTFLPFACR